MIPIITTEVARLCELMGTELHADASMPLDKLLSVSDYRLHTADYASRRLEACAELRRVTAAALQDTAGSVTVSDLEALHYPRLGVIHDHGGGRTVLCSAETLTLISAAPLPASLQVVLEPDAHAMLMSPAHSVAMAVGCGVAPSVACVAPGSYAYTATPVLLHHYGSPVWLQHEGTAAAAPY